MKSLTTTTLLLALSLSFSACKYTEKVESRLKQISGYERAALTLSKENRELKAQLATLQFEIQGLKTKNNFLTVQLEKKKAGREIASVAPVNPENDLVKFETYRWSPSQLLAMAQKEFDDKNYEKSAQFFKTFMGNYSDDKRIDDLFLFQAGIASFESGVHHDWTIETLSQLIKEYPVSKYYRGAKLWIALTNLKLGKNDEFFNTVEEFRKKYRNTPEWKVLSTHYEEIMQKYKK